MNDNPITRDFHAHLDVCRRCRAGLLEAAETAKVRGDVLLARLLALRANRALRPVRDAPTAEQV